MNYPLVLDTAEKSVDNLTPRPDGIPNIALKVSFWTIWICVENSEVYLENFEIISEKSELGWEISEFGL